ncbi:hypothetical protein HDE_07965 [Halotydeus destructor]|nr:hypothetical protein HDE_07965 [Halotydeus destructor]
MRVLCLISLQVVCREIITTLSDYQLAAWSGLTAFGLRCAAMLVLHIRLWIKLDTIGETFEEYHRAMSIMNRKTMAKISKLGCILIGVMTMVLALLITFRLKLDLQGQIELAVDILPWNAPIKAILVQLMLVMSIGTFFYVAIFIYAMSQVSLLLLTKQSLQKAILSRKGSIKTVNEIRLTNGQLLTWHKMAADGLDIVPDVLTGVLFLNLALYVHDYLEKPLQPLSNTNIWFVATDMILLLVILTAIVVLGIVVKGQYVAFRNEAMKMTEPDVDDNQKDIAISKLSLLTDLSTNQLEATQVLDLLDFDRSFPIKFLGSLLPFATMIITPIMNNAKSTKQL